MKKLLFVCFVFVEAFFAACSDEGEESGGNLELPGISGLDSVYIVSSGEELTLSPRVEDVDLLECHWFIGEEEVAETLEYTFRESANGVYDLRFQVRNQYGAAEKRIKVIVTHERIELETYCNTLLEIDLPGIGEGGADAGMELKVLHAASPLCRFAAVDGKPIFVAARPGEYELEAVAGKITGCITVRVEASPEEQSPYFAEVFDYLPAPGQFVNELPKYHEGDTREDMLQAVREWLTGEDTYMITLGGWGGYVTVGFDHTVVNVAGKRDFRIKGNAFGAALGRPGAPFGGSCEPGIVQVAYDKNKNGRPDEEEWYEIKGSSNFSAETEPWYAMARENGNDLQVYRDYEMTYYRPEREKAEEGGEQDDPMAFESVKRYIRWEDNQGNSGYKVKNVYHAQTYYPAWIKEDQLVFKGIRLPENAINEGKFVPGINEGNVYFVLYGFRYGYVDNRPNGEDGSAIDIDWAIDRNGNPVGLPGIDFVRIYNGVNQENGWLGECSTEVDRGEDLHLLGQEIDTVEE